MGARFAKQVTLDLREEKRVQPALSRTVRPKMENTAQPRIAMAHGRHVAKNAVSLGLNLEALANMSSHDARRAISLVKTIRAGNAWRRERIRMSDEDYALVVAALSTTATPVDVSDVSETVSDADIKLDVEVPQAAQEPPPPEPPVSAPGTVARSRSRRA